jgi:hypothetical protein
MAPTPTAPGTHSSTGVAQVWPVLLLAAMLQGAAACGGAAAPESLPRSLGAILPDTGQLDSGASVFGADSDYVAHAPAYQAPGDGTVLDLVTGLSWQLADDPTPITWQAAADRCRTLSLGGHRDWRLPEFMELLGISNPGGALVDAATFPRGGFDAFWTANPGPPEFPGSHWMVDWVVRGVGGRGGTGEGLARCVRGLAYPARALVDGGDGTVLDAATGLQWQRQPSTSTLTWTEAITWCEALTLASRSDWRLPNLIELASLVEPGRYWPAIDTSHFPLTGGDSNEFWTSTGTHPDAGFTIRFNDGFMWDGNDAWFRMKVRCVRGGS